MIKSLHDLEVYTLSYGLAIEIEKKIIVRLPKHERLLLADQMRRASRSIPANIAEGYAKRQSVKEFKRYLKSAIGSCNEMTVHLSMAKDFSYLDGEYLDNLLERYDILGRKLNKLIQNWQKF